ncbi:phosphatidylinositol 5-phosphate 4-kinase type-2 alpha-like [Sycon ciliatum]|uniref:phosphatidylinositol 5-phosphate 4-kinase type-2 alpha-like n=1 Tax=Sycon ciliatum TaxID=27933 RepID=UPI0031F6C5FB
MPGGKKKKKGKKGPHVVHQKKRVFRASEPLLSVFMWGINHSISGLNHVNVPSLLLPDDFRAYTKIRIENHLYNKDIFPGKYKFKSYCPLAFHDLRKRFGVDDTTFMNSLTLYEPQPTDSPGRSGAKFYVSHDNRFIIKTILSEEVALFHQIIVQYHQYVVESEGKTLLPQYLGMYRVTVGSTETYILVMRSIFSSTLSVHRKYDLKGSTYTRSASDKERAKDLPTLKDNDFTGDGMKLTVGAANKEEILGLLEADTNFLTGLKLMDYSLLVGIHDAEREQQEAVKRHEADEEEEAAATGGSGEETCDEEFSGEEHGTETEPAAGERGERGVAFAVPRVLRAPNAVVVSSSEDVKRAATLDYYPIVNRQIDYYAFALNHLEARPSVVSGDGADGGAASSMVATSGEATKAEASDTAAASASGSPTAAAASAAAATSEAAAATAGAISPRDPASRTDSGIRGGKVYYLGLIDVLTHYGPRKMAAHTAKTVKHRSDEISTINPKAYAQRFVEFLDRHIL